MTREYAITLYVEAPHTTNENEVERRINEALDEPPCDWGEWSVGYATVRGVHISQPTTSNSEV